MKITHFKDMMLMVLVGMRRDTIVAYDNIRDDPSAEEAYYVLASYAEHVREARKYGIKLGDILRMHGYFDELMNKMSNPVDRELFEIIFQTDIGMHQFN